MTNLHILIPHFDMFQTKTPTENILTRQKQFSQKTVKISAPNPFFQNEPKSLYLILDFFNKFYQLEITIWRKKRED